MTRSRTGATRRPLRRVRRAVAAVRKAPSTRTPRSAPGPETLVLVTATDSSVAGLGALLELLPPSLSRVVVAPWGRCANTVRAVEAQDGIEVLPPRDTAEQAAWQALGTALQRGHDVLVLDAAHRVGRAGLAALLAAGEAREGDLVTADPDRWGVPPQIGADLRRAPRLAASPDVPYWVSASLVGRVPAAPDAAPLLALLSHAERVRLVPGTALLGRLPTFHSLSVDSDPAEVTWPAWERRLGAERQMLTSPEARRAWALGRLAEDLEPSVSDADGMDDPTWATLVRCLRGLLEDAGEDLSELPVRLRLFAWLGAHGDRVGYGELLEWSWETQAGPEAELVDGRIVLGLPLLGTPGRPPRSWATPSPEEARPRARVVRVRPRGEHWELDVVVSVLAPGDLTGGARVLAAHAGGEPLTVSPLEDDPVLLHVRGDKDPARSPSGVVLRLTQAQLDAARVEPPQVRVEGPGTEAPVEVPCSGLGDFPAWRLAPASERRGSAPVAVTDVRLGPGPTLLVGLVWREGAPADWSTSLVRGGAQAVELPGTIAPDPQAPLDADRYLATLPLTRSAWGRPTAPLSKGSLALEVRVGDRVIVPDTASPTSSELAGRLPLDLHDGTVTVRLTEGARGRLKLRLVSPLGEDAVGPRQQRALQRGLRADRRIEPGTVLMQSYVGQVASDSQRALHEELRRSRPDLRVRWTVVDHSVEVPFDAEALVLHSTAWYEALATSQYVCWNTPAPNWFVERPGQKVLQTFHGYSAKLMGVDHWISSGQGPLRIARSLRTFTLGWDALLTPNPAQDVHHREQYRFGGTIISEGLPRNDDLHPDRRGALRARGRADLGVRPDQKVLLYAPTWREHLSIASRVSHLDSHLDLDQVTAELGEEWVVLLRGHRFHLGGRRPDATRVVDVTEHPEINELVAASDVAVLDYSSLRFDVAVAEVPAVFLVPDLEEYSHGGRGFLFPYAPTAPGPMLRTTGEVIAVLRDLDGLRAEVAPRIAEFNATWNPLQDGQVSARVAAAFFTD